MGKLLENLKEYSGEDQVVSIHEMKVRMDNQPEAIIQVRSQIPTLDNLIGDFRDGELIAVSGPTKMGKTLLAQTLTTNFCKQNQFSLWFSFEVPVRQFISQFPTLPMIYVPAKLKVHVMDWIEARIIESFQKYHTRIVFIDHLHFLFDMAKVRSPSLEIGTVVRRLKTIAVSNGFIIFLLCHTTKGKGDETEGYEAIRDSSFISQESDTVFMIRRTPNNGETAARLRVEFHRRTGVLEQTIDLHKEHGLLVETIRAERDDNQGYRTKR